MANNCKRSLKEGMEIQIDPHTLERAEERGTNEEQNEAPCGKPQGISIKKIISLVIAMTARKCHCEEQSDEAI